MFKLGSLAVLGTVGGGSGGGSLGPIQSYATFTLLEQNADQTKLAYLSSNQGNPDQDVTYKHSGLYFYDGSSWLPVRGSYLSEKATNITGLAVTTAKVIFPDAAAGVEPWIGPDELKGTMSDEYSTTYGTGANPTTSGRYIAAFRPAMVGGFTVRRAEVQAVAAAGLAATINIKYLKYNFTNGSYTDMAAPFSDSVTFTSGGAKYRGRTFSSNISFRQNEGLLVLFQRENDADAVSKEIGFSVTITATPAF